MEGGPSFGIPPHRQASHGKRSYSQMEGHYRESSSPLFVQQHSSSPERNSPSPPHHIPRIALPPLRPRFAGDGFDFRRPASTMNNNPSPVIDLTDDDDSAPSTYATPQPEPSAAAPPTRPQRLPRFSREIIDLSADTSPPEPTHAQLPPPLESQSRGHGHAHAHSHHAASATIRSSPEVLFVSERQRSTNSAAQDVLQHPEPDRPVLDLTADNDDEVVHVRTMERAGVNLFGPQEPPAHRLQVGRLAELFARAGRVNGGVGNMNIGAFFFGRTQNQRMDEDEGDDGPQILRFPATARRANIPMAMDYTTVGFEAFDATPPRQPTPKYSPPPDPGAGFTRSPEEDDVLICPNCKDELGIGSTEQKKQVWIVKACGHVYCGECMQNRKTKRKGKAKVTDPSVPPAFSTCQVSGCSKKTNTNQVMQIFL